MIYIVNALLVIIAGVFISLASLSEEGKLGARFNKSDTWMNKYSQDSINKWLNYKGELKPKFFGSTTLLVWTVDWFHFSQMIYKTAIELLISVNLFNGWWILVSFVAIKLIFSGVAQATRWLFTSEIDG